jgi:hypothetical protein
MAINFPDSPANNDTFTSGGKTWLYNGTSWALLTLTQNVVLANSITSSAIVDGTIVNADINASAAIDKTKISGTAITAGDTGTVTSTMIVDGTIVDADINASAAINTTKITNWEDDQVVLSNQIFG